MNTAVMALIGLAFLFVGWILMFLLPGTRSFGWGIIAPGAALLVIAAVIDFRRVKRALVSLRGKFSVSTAVMISLLIGIVMFANAISISNYRRFDLTGLAQFTLTLQTKNVLAKLDKPVEVVLFFSPSIPLLIRSYTKDLLKEYQNYTDQLTVKEIDPEIDPNQARQYGIDQFGAMYGTVVFRSKLGQLQVFGPQIASGAENAFTSALLEVTGTKLRKVYFITGHGEASIHSNYQRALKGLRDNLFQVDDLDLVAASAIPEDAAVVAITGPQKPLLSNELEIIRAYLKNHGRLLVLLNPNPLQGLRGILAEWGIDTEDGILIDPESYVVPNKDNLLVPRTRDSFGLAETYFPGATAVIPKQPAPDNVKLSPLVWTSPDAWLEKNYVAGEEPVFNKRLDKKGPLAIGALVSSTSSNNTESLDETRLVIIGNSDFASDEHFTSGNNGDLFLTAVNWLTEGKEVVSVERRVLDVRRLILSPEEARFLQISSVGLLPLLVLVAGAIVWWRRR